MDNNIFIPERPEYIQDTKRVARALREDGYNVTLEQAEKLWQKYSDSCCSGWEHLPDLDEQIVERVRYYIVKE